MKKKCFHFLLFVFCSFFSFSQTLTPVENQEGKWGLVNENNELIVNYIHDYIDNNFEDFGFAFAFNDSFCILLDKSGKETTGKIDNCRYRFAGLWDDTSLVYGILNNGGESFQVVSKIELIVEMDQWGSENILYLIQTEHILSEKGLFGICHNGIVSNIEFENIKAPSVYILNDDEFYIQYRPFGVDTAGHIFAVDVINSLGIPYNIPEGNFHPGRLNNTEEEILNEINDYLSDFNIPDIEQLIPLDLFDIENIRFMVRQNSKWGVIDKEMKIVLPCEYDDIVMKSEQIVATKNSVSQYFDYHGNELDTEGLRIVAQIPETFTDSRDGKTYKTVKIGNQTWMAENLNFTTAEGSWCYDDDTVNCNKYGRLYSWETARDVCPAGWHLPSKAEFETLLSNVGGSGSNAYYALKDCGSSGFNALFG